MYAFKINGVVYISSHAWTALEQYEKDNPTLVNVVDMQSMGEARIVSDKSSDEQMALYYVCAALLPDRVAAVKAYRERKPGATVTEALAWINKHFKNGEAK